MSIIARTLGFEIKFAPTDYLHLLNNEQVKECFKWMNKNKGQRINDWPGWKLLNLPH